MAKKYSKSGNRENCNNLSSGCLDITHGIEGNDNYDEFGSLKNNLRKTPLLEKPVDYSDSGLLYVKYNTRLSIQSLDDVKTKHNLLSAVNATRLPDKLPSIANVVVVEVSGDIEKAKQKFRQDPNVEYVENVPLEIPNFEGEMFPTQEEYFEKVYPNPYQNNKMHWEEAIDEFGFGNFNVRIGMRENGYTWIKHPDLDGKVYNVPSHYEDTSYGEWCPEEPWLCGTPQTGEHATAVSSIIAGKSDDWFGMTGVCPNCSVLGVGGYPDPSCGTWGMDCIIEQGIKVTNQSFSNSVCPCNGPSTTQQNLANDAAALGILIVNSAGNNNTDIDFGDIYLYGEPQPTYSMFPCAYDGVFCVSMDNGLGCAGTEVVDISAIGEMLGANTPTIGNGWEYNHNHSCPNGVSSDICNTFTEFGGTSGAAPIVTGLFGYLLSHNPELTRDQLIEIVTLTANPSYWTPDTFPDQSCTNSDLYRYQGWVEDNCGSNYQVHGYFWGGYSDENCCCTMGGSDSGPEGCVVCDGDNNHPSCQGITQSSQCPCNDRPNTIDFLAAIQYLYDNYPPTEGLTGCNDENACNYGFYEECTYLQGPGCECDLYNNNTPLPGWCDCNTQVDGPGMCGCLTIDEQCGFLSGPGTESLNADCVNIQYSLDCDQSGLNLIDSSYPCYGSNNNGGLMTNDDLEIWAKCDTGVSVLFKTCGSPCDTDTNGGCDPYYLYESGNDACQYGSGQIISSYCDCDCTPPDENGVCYDCIHPPTDCYIDDEVLNQPDNTQGLPGVCVGHPSEQYAGIPTPAYCDGVTRYCNTIDDCPGSSSSNPCPGQECNPVGGIEECFGGAVCVPNPNSPQGGCCAQMGSGVGGRTKPKYSNKELQNMSVEELQRIKNQLQQGKEKTPISPQLDCDDCIGPICISCKNSY